MDKLTKQIMIKANDILSKMDFPNSNRIDKHILNAEFNRKIRMNKEMNRILLIELIKMGRLKKRRDYMLIKK
jgi:hypothetical protein